MSQTFKYKESDIQTMQRVRSWPTGLLTGLPMCCQWLKNPAANTGDARDSRVPSLGQEDPLEQEMATYSSILAWKIPRTEEPGRLQSIGL